jgi:hypothetical protein
MVREVRPDDLCFLTEKEYIWAEMLADVLTQQNIRFMQKSVMGAGLALKVGPILDRIRFFVLQKDLAEAEEIVAGLFPDTDGENGEAEDQTLILPPSED